MKLIVLFLTTVSLGPLHATPLTSNWNPLGAEEPISSENAGFVLSNESEGSDSKPSQSTTSGSAVKSTYLILFDAKLFRVEGVGEVVYISLVGCLIFAIGCILLYKCVKTRCGKDKPYDLFY